MTESSQLSIVLLLGHIVVAVLLVALAVSGAWLWLIVALAVLVAGSAATVAGTFVFSEIFKSPRNTEERLSPIGTARLLAAEWAVASALYGGYHAFAGKARVRPSEGRRPVLLLHGFMCNSGFWTWHRRWLENHGFAVYTINLPPHFRRFHDVRDALDRHASELFDHHQESSWIVMGHSMGGVMARAWLSESELADRVELLVTLGSPFSGTQISRLIGPLGPAHPTAEWIEHCATPIDTRHVSLYSTHDNIVTPQSSSELPDADLIRVHGVGHLNMATSGRVRRELAELLDLDAPRRHQSA